MGNELTKIQQQILNFIKKRTTELGVPPSYREIQKHFGYKAIGSVQDHLRALTNKGVLERAGGKSKRLARGLLPKGMRLESAVRVPIYGEIAAGLAKESQQLEMGEAIVAGDVAKKPSFALRVSGTSMIDVGIFEGDVLIVDRSAEIKNGDIVVANIEGETTVKRYQKSGNAIFLIPENKRFKPIRVTQGQFELQGKVVALQRKF